MRLLAASLFKRMSHATATSARRDLLSSRFRANPEYELVLFDRLPEQQQTLLAGLRRDPDLYGILRPRQSAGADCGTKSISRDAALLYLTLAGPAPLPSYVAPSLGHSVVPFVQQLVLDRVLEIEHDGCFVTGSNACHALALYPGNSTKQTRLSQLSRQALKFAGSFPAGDVHQLASRLYSYNRAPASPEWRRRLHSREATSLFLGKKVLASLDGSGVIHFPAQGSGGWLAWSFGPPTHALASGNTYKLYISPRVDALPEVFAQCASFAPASLAYHFKIGSDLSGLLRPDKMVMYFSSFADLGESSTRLQEKLGSSPAQGVPFTAQLSGSGLLSWGMDPPGTDSLPWFERESWRQWVTNRLAIALWQAQAEDCGDPCEFALNRLRLEGIDSDTWRPGRAFGHPHPRF